MAFAATTEFDVRSSGSDANGGGFNTSASGTDYSQQNSAQVAYTDLAIDATTNTKVTSAAHPFDSTSPGNIINVTGGTGFTVQRVQIVSVAAGVATCDKSLGTLSSTAGTGNLGGSLLTIGTANGLAISSNTVHIKAATYTLTSAITIGAGVATVTWTGFNSTHNDGGTKPLITTATNSTVLVQTASTGGVQTFKNISLSNTAGVRASGINQPAVHGTGQWWIFLDCVFDGFTTGVDSSNGVPDDVAVIVMERCEVKNCTTGFSSTNSTLGSLFMLGCYFHANGADVLTGGSSPYCLLRRSIFTNCTGDSLNVNNPVVVVENCTVTGATGKGLWPSNSITVFTLNNNIIYNNNYGVYFSSASPSNWALAGRNNAFQNTSGNNNWNGSPGDIALSADPFVNSAAGNYALNSTTGGGAACRQAAFPGAFQGGTSTSYLDVGAVQTSGSPGSSAGGSYTWIG